MVGLTYGADPQEGAPKEHPDRVDWASTKADESCQVLEESGQKDMRKEQTNWGVKRFSSANQS